jgi:hypothetical protein
VKIGQITKNFFAWNYDVLLIINNVLKFNPLHVFVSQDQVNTAVKLEKESIMKYPNVTVCFAKFFDTRLLEGILLFGISFFAL